MTYQKFKKRYLAIVAIGTLIETLTELQYDDNSLTIRLINYAEKGVKQFKGNMFSNLHWLKKPLPVEDAYKHYKANTI